MGVFTFFDCYNIRCFKVFKNYIFVCGVENIEVQTLKWLVSWLKDYLSFIGPMDPQNQENLHTTTLIGLNVGQP